MRTKRREISPTSKQQLPILLLLIILVIQQSESKFLSEQTINEGLTAPNAPSAAFFYKGNLIAAISILNGATLDYKASLVQYSPTGEITQNLTFPLSCQSLYCNIDVDYPQIQSNLLYILVNADGCCSSFRFAVYEIDLDLFEITNEIVYKPNALTGNFYPQNWLPFNSTIALWSSIGPFGLANLSPFDFSALNLINETKVPIKSNGISYGGSSSSLSNENLLFTCGYDTNYDYFLQTYDVRTHQLTSQSKSLFGCGWASFIGDSSEIVIATEVKEGISLIVFDLINETLPNFLPDKIIYNGGYLTGFLVDDINNIFMSTRQWSDQKNSTIVQVKFNGNSVENSFEVLDEYKVANGFLAQQTYGNVLSMGVDSTAQEISSGEGEVVFILSGTSSSSSRSLLLLSYDSS